MQNRGSWIGFRALVIGAVLGLAVGCATTADVDDNTPPTVELRYRFEGEKWKVVPLAGRTVDFRGDVLYLWAIGRDSKGVERVVIRGEGEVTCRHASGSKYDEDVSVREVHAEDADVGDGDRTESVRNVTLNWEPCGSDPHTSGTVAFQAEARNFAGDTAESGVLTVNL